MFLLLMFYFYKVVSLVSELFSIKATCIRIEKSVDIKSLYSVYFDPSITSTLSLF